MFEPIIHNNLGVQEPYTCAGEDIIRAGKVIVSGFGEYGVSPDSIIPALGA